MESLLLPTFSFDSQRERREQRTSKEQKKEDREYGKCRVKDEKKKREI
jgi:hypothetical protein